MADASAIRCARRAEGYPNGTQQHETHTEDIFLQAARQFSWQRSNHARCRQMESTSENLATDFSSPRARKIYRNVRRVRRSPSQQVAREGWGGYKRHRVRQQLGL